MSPRYSEDMDIDVLAGRVATLKKHGYKILNDRAFRRSLRAFDIADIEINDPSKAKQTDTTQRFRCAHYTGPGRRRAKAARAGGSARHPGARHARPGDPYPQRTQPTRAMVETAGQQRLRAGAGMSDEPGLGRPGKSAGRYPVPVNTQESSFCQAARAGSCALGVSAAKVQAPYAATADTDAYSVGDELALGFD